MFPLENEMIEFLSCSETQHSPSLTFIVNGFAEDAVANEVSFTFTCEITIGIRANSIGMAGWVKAFIDICIKRENGIEVLVSFLSILITYRHSDEHRHQRSLNYIYIRANSARNSAGIELNRDMGTNRMDWI